MDDSRDVFLTIGKGTYNIKTPLGEDVLERVKDLIDGFEVIQGNMDDVFLNVTKEEEATS